MPKEDTATVADETAIVEEQTTAPELSQAEQDALLSIAEGVEGTLTDNTPAETNDETAEPTDTETAEGSDEADEAAADDSGDVSTADDSEADTTDDGESTTADSTTSEPAPELATEKDEAGVFDAQPVQDPGEFKAGDYSFQVTTTDGKSYNITNLEEAEAFAAQLDQQPELISASQFMALNRKTAMMERGILEDQQKWEAQKATYDQQKALAETRDSTINQWNNEINYLATNGDIPAITDEMNSADWTNPEVAKDPAVKARLEIFKWMEGENNKRMAAGLDPIRSVIDAHNAMQLDAMRKQNRETVTREKKTRQAKGSMIGGSAPYQPSNNPANSIVGAGGSLDDIILEYMNQ